MKVAIYARVSTDDKDQNPERQLIRCKDYCELHDHQILGAFQEHISGDTSPFQRKAFCQMMELQPQGIVIFSIDRLTRQHPNKVMLLLQQFKDQGVIIISITEPVFNMESAFAEPLLYLLSWWNNYFLIKLKEDIKSGLERARKQGKTLGRPKVRFNQYRAYELLINQNKTLTEVSEELGTSRATLHRFKKVCEKNPSLYKMHFNISESGDLETE